MKLKQTPDYENESYEVRARRGEALLNVRVPGWRDKIDKDDLDLGDCHSCVLGQIHGIYLHGVVDLFFDYVVPREASAAHGFNFGQYDEIDPFDDDDDNEYVALSEVWVHVINNPIN